jgi:alkylated DNA nucleotide flippase Atl1
LRAVQTTLGQLLSPQRQYHIPLFQRPYTWSHINLQTLWDDIVELASKEDGLGATHFIGSFVLVPPAVGMSGDVDEVLVIDGQQRMTSLILALAAARDALLADHANEAASIAETYLTNRLGTSSQRLKLTPTRADRESFADCVTGTEPTGPDTKVRSAFRFFTARFAQAGDDGQRPDPRAVWRTIVSRLSLVEIAIESKDNPYRIFESLNATGVDLTQADLLRNYVFMRLGSRGEDVYRKHWLPMQELLGDNMVGLARADLLSQGIDVKVGDVYRTHQAKLDKEAPTPESVEAWVAHLAIRARNYQRLVNPASEPDEAIRRILERLARWQADATHPLLLYLYDLVTHGDATTDELRDAVILVESFVVRRFLYGVSSKTLNRLFVDAIKSVPKDKSIVESVRTYLSGERRYWPTDDQIRSAALDRPFYITGRADQRRIVLERLEQSFGHAEPVDPRAKLTIEHVLPQHLSQEWRDYLAAQGDDPDQVHQEMVHTLGNLSLTAYNAVLSDNPMQRKQQIYDKSHLSLNESIAKAPNWNAEAIRERGRDLASRLISMWPGPLPGGRGAVQGFDWSRVDSAVAAIPAGHWSTYRDVALVGGTAPVPVGGHLNASSLPRAYRVLDSQGRVAQNFRWPDPSDHRDPRQILESEGVSFDADGKADPSRRIGALQLAAAIGFEFDEEELREIQSAIGAAGADGELAQRHVDRRVFWQQLLEKAKEKNSLHHGVKPSTDSWLSAGAGRTGLSWVYRLRGHNARVQLYIDVGDAAKNRDLLKQFEEHRSEIEKAFGGQLSWTAKEGVRACGIRYQIDTGGRDDRDKWDSIQTVMIDAMTRLHNALDPSVRRL